MLLNPANWYWAVAGSMSQVWASARVEYVPTTDATYVAWLAEGYKASPIGSITELYGVLVAAWEPLVLAAGVQITSTATPTLNAIYDVDPVSLSQIAAISTGIAAGKGLPGGGSTFNYPDATGTMHSFTSANFLNFAAAIETFIYQFDQALVTLLGGGSASLPSSALTIA